MKVYVIYNIFKKKSYVIQKRTKTNEIESGFDEDDYDETVSEEDEERRK